MTVVRIRTTRTTKNGGVAGVRARLEGGAVRQAMVPISQALLTDILRTFETQTDPWGKPWPKLSRATIENRLRVRKGTRKLLRAPKRGRSTGRSLALVGAAASSKALIDTGTYRASLHAFVEGHRAGVSTNDVRRNVLQFGNPENRFPNGTYTSRGRLRRLGDVRGGVIRTRSRGKEVGPGPVAPIPPRPHFPIRPNGQVDVPAAWIDEYLEMIRMAVMEGGGAAARTRGGAAQRAIASVGVGFEGGGVVSRGGSRVGVRSFGRAR